MNGIHDLIIVGAGPAGLTASIYSSRYGVSHVIVGSILGGQISETHLIDNYPGLEDMSGFEFSERWKRHVEKYGVKILSRRVKKISRQNDIFSLDIEGGEPLLAKTVILSTGMKRRKLNARGEDEFKGRGVSYCATCDGFFYKNKRVAVIGGGNSALGAANYLANISQKVYVIYRKKELRAESFWVNLANQNDKIEIIFNTNILEFLGEEKIQKIKLDRKYEGREYLEVDGVFIEVGSNPDIEYARELGIETDECGCIKIKKDGATNISGVWAAGDITDGSDGFRQVITAASEGAIAARSVFNWLKKQKS